MSPSADLPLRRGVCLAGKTTLGLGGPAQWFVSVCTAEQLGQALQFAGGEQLGVTFLGGGSNVVVSDGGVGGLTVELALTGVEYKSGRQPDEVLVTAAAGEPLDRLVADTVARGLTGLECLSGIPGSVGATPIQNVGAYGAEVADCLFDVQVLDLRDGSMGRLGAAQCEFGYRDSRFRKQPGRFVIVSVTFALHAGRPAAPKYPELARALTDQERTPARIRQHVLALRRSKSMVYEPAGPLEHRLHSAGSFFKNPVLGTEQAREAAERLWRSGAIDKPTRLPTFASGADRVKVPAAYLIERCGFMRGLRRGEVGLSPRHALCLVHHGGGSTAALIDFARDMQAGVLAGCGVQLLPEPVFVGFTDRPMPGAVLSTGWEPGQASS